MTTNSTHTLQKAVEDNPIGLPQETASGLIGDLNDHVAAFAILFHQYQKHHWLVEGPQFRDLHMYLEESYTGVQQALDALAERITVLGGIPLSGPRAQADASYIDHEPEGGSRVRTMLENDLGAEQAIIIRLRSSVELASRGRDYGTERLLKSILFEAENRAHHLDHYLQQDTLTSLATNNGVS